MKKWIKILVTVGLILAATLAFGGCSGKNKDAAANATNIDGSTVGSSDDTGLYPVKLPNRDCFVYIEGVDEATAEDINNIFIGIESGVAETEENAWIFEMVTPEWLSVFDPDFDLVEAAKSLEFVPNDNLKWVTSAQEKLQNGNTYSFYFRLRDDGNYEMSEDYIKLGTWYANVWKIDQQPTTEAEVELETDVQEQGE